MNKKEKEGEDGSPYSLQISLTLEGWSSINMCSVWET